MTDLKALRAEEEGARVAYLEAGIVSADYDPRSCWGFIDLCEWNGKIFFHRSRVIGQPLTPGAPVTFARGTTIDNRGYQRPCATEIRRLCPFDYRAGDALDACEA